VRLRSTGRTTDYAIVTCEQRDLIHNRLPVEYQVTPTGAGVAGGILDYAPFRSSLESYKRLVSSLVSKF